MSINERLRDARKGASMTQEDVQGLTGINKKTISNWENGVSRPDVDSLALLCKTYKINPNSIFEEFDDYMPKIETEEYLEYLHKRPEMKMLFRASKNVSKAQLEQIVKMIESFAPQDYDEEY